MDWIWIYTFHLIMDCHRRTYLFLGRYYEKSARTDYLKKWGWPISLRLKHLKSVIPRAWWRANTATTSLQGDMVNEGWSATYGLLGAQVWWRKIVQAEKATSVLTEMAKYIASGICPDPAQKHSKTNHKNRISENSDSWGRKMLKVQFPVTQ